MPSRWSKISGKRVRPPTNHFCTVIEATECLTTFPLTVFTQKNFVADFKRSVIFYGNRPFCLLRPPLGDLGATYDDHLTLIGKRVIDFILALIERFSLGVTAEALRANIGWKSAISLQRGSVDPKFHVEGVTPTNHSSQKTRINDLSCDTEIWTDLSSILSQSTRSTDRRIDGQTDRRTDRHNFHR